MMPEPHPAMPDSTPSRRNLAARLRQWRLRSAARPHHAARPRQNLLATLREWHKRIGLFAFFFMGWLGLSGFLINQSASWGYDTVRIDWGWVMALYGLYPEPPRTGFVAGDRWLAVTADYTLFDASPLSERIAEPRGFVESSSGGERLLYVATESSLVVLSLEGERYDELRSPILPVSTVRRVGTAADGSAIAVQDLDAYQSSDGGNNWQTVDPAKVSWSIPQAMPEAERSRLLEYSRPSVSLEHVLVDMHSGRLFGEIGAWVINAVGFAAIWLAISGTWMWYRINANRRRAGR
jgi:hypothetical protein